MTSAMVLLDIDILAEFAAFHLGTIVLMLKLMGIFGQSANSEELKEKIGDFTALATGQTALQYQFFEDDQFHPQLGTHGGMTSEEKMIIRLLSVKLSKLDNKMTDE